MLALAVRNTGKLIRRAVAEEGVRLGRYFTPKTVAAELSHVLPIPEKSEIRLLDAGAGTGILTAAAIEAICRAGHVKRVTVDAYETDERFLPVLADNLERIRRRARHDFGVRLEIHVLAEDFLADARGLAEPGEASRYDIVLLSPPVGVSDEGSAAEAFCRRVLPRGTDLAFLFAEAAASRLDEDGVMAAILPISFADSIHAAPLRERLFARAPLVSLTLDAGRRGNRRDKTMLAVFRYGEEPEALTVRVQDGDAIHTLSPIPYDVAVFSGEYKILLPKSDADVALVSAMNDLPCRLEDLGLTVKTGLVIESRYRECLRPSREGGAVPLLHPAGLYDGTMHFPPPGRPTPYVLPRIPSLAEPNRTMVLLKRVPAKRDGRHLVVGVYFSGQLPRDAYISTDNKLNVIRAVRGEMAADLASGLAAVLASQYYERYLTLTGALDHVNAGALAALPLPDRETILAVGRRLSVVRSYSLRMLDTISSEILSSIFGVE